MHSSHPTRTCTVYIVGCWVVDRLQEKGKKSSIHNTDQISTIHDSSQKRHLTFSRLLSRHCYNGRLSLCCHCCTRQGCVFPPSIFTINVTRTRFPAWKHARKIRRTTSQPQSVSQVFALVQRLWGANVPGQLVPPFNGCAVMIGSLLSVPVALSHSEYCPQVN